MLLESHFPKDFPLGFPNSITRLFGLCRATTLTD